MKTYLKLTLTALILTFNLMMYAQSPPHPNSGGEPGSGNTVVGGQQGGAPVGSGNIILLLLASVYAAHKLLRTRSESELAEE